MQELREINYCDEKKTAVHTRGEGLGELKKKPWCLTDEVACAFALVWSDRTS